MEINDIFNIQFKTSERTVEELICPRCITNPISTNISTTDNTTRICEDCAKTERGYAAAKARGASDFTLNMWGYEQSNWPVH